MTDNGYQKMSLTQRQKKLETMLVCPCGKGQVYIRNLIDPAQRAAEPHLALRCRVRETLGIKSTTLFVEEIVLTCCKDPMQSCAAYQRYMEKNAAG